jgi:hypothetical protein
MKSSSDGAQTSELRGLTITTTKRDITTLNPTYQADRDLVMKQDVIPFKQLSKLTGPRAERTKVAGRDNEECEHDENVMLPMIVSTTVAVPVSKAKIARQHAVGNRNQGPWSREAFDLFDWRPGTSTTEDSLAVG